MFTSIFKDLQSLYSARHEPENIRPLAEAYWRLLLMIGLAMVIGVLIYGTGEFFGVISNLSAEDPSNTPSASTALNRTQLQKVLTSVSERQQRFSAPQTAAIFDPSK
jgi:hypothetical protein